MIPYVPPFAPPLGVLRRPAPKYRLRRGLFHWQVGYWDHGYAGSDFEHSKFWRKSAATAYLVQLALEGERVQL